MLGRTPWRTPLLTLLVDEVLQIRPNWKMNSGGSYRPDRSFSLDAEGDYEGYAINFLSNADSTSLANRVICPLKRASPRPCPSVGVQRRDNRAGGAKSSPGGRRGIHQRVDSRINLFALNKSVICRMGY